MKLFYLLIVFSLIGFLNSCDNSIEDSYVEVVAKDFRFEVVDEISSGWNTFQFKNVGHAEHFFLLNLIPDSISFDRYRKEVTRPFDIVFDSIKAGKSKADAIGMLVEMIPAWYFTSVKQMGGTGLVSSGKTTTVTLNLTPGTYVMECYIKEQGVFHTALGMIKSITVGNEDSNLEPPEANMDITLSNFKIETRGKIETGKNTIAVHFNEHPEAGLGNDVHLIRINDETNIEDVVNWLDWMNIKGLESPAPVEFLGGTQEMPIGQTSYFTVDLKTGEYCWISESSASKGMIKRFRLN